MIVDENLIEKILHNEKTTVFPARTNQNPTIIAINPSNKRFLKRLSEGSTKNRKHLKYILAVNDKLYTSKSIFFKHAPRNAYGSVFFTIDELKEKDDPVKYIVDSFTASRKWDYFNVQVTEDYMVFGAGNTGSVFLATRRSIPRNAVPISLNPLRFLQIGKCKVLITNGKYWLTEDIGECDYKWLTVKRKKNHYEVYMYVAHGALEVGGPFIFEKSTPLSRLVKPEITDNAVIFQSKDTKIMLSPPGTLNEYNREFKKTASVQLNSLLSFATVLDPESNSTFYVPKNKLEGVIGL